MWLSRMFRKSSRGLFSYREAIVCVAVLSMLFARGAPPRLPRALANPAVTTGDNHSHRACFDQEEFQWGMFASFALSAPLPAEMPHLMLSAQPSLEVESDGWHYNRPPPIG